MTAIEMIEKEIERLRPIAEDHTQDGFSHVPFHLASLETLLEQIKSNEDKKTENWICKDCECEGSEHEATGDCIRYFKEQHRILGEELKALEKGIRG